MTTRHADALVIGAGASGGVTALRLAARGWRVVCLEQGPWPDPAAYPGATPEWELWAMTKWASVPSVRNAPADYPVDLSDSELGIVNWNGVGGGTVLYAAQWPRMRPNDFRVHTIDGVADDWPLTYEELRPFYEETDRQFGVSGLGGNPAYPPGADPPLPPLPIGAAGLRVARAHHRLGWHWWPATNAILSAPYEGRRACVQRGSCGQGCNEGAKGSADVTHFPKFVAAGGELITGARVRRILVDASCRAYGAEWVDREGHEHRQTADVVVLAANAIGTARLLLASADPTHVDGLANSSGLVGRRLMLHPLCTIAGVFDEPLQGWRAHNGGLIQSVQFSDSDPARGFVRGATWGLGTAAGPMRCLYSPDGKGVWGDGHHQHVRERLGRTAQWAVLCEDLPEDHNTVTLSSTDTDSDGIPAAKVTYQVSANSHAAMRWQSERARESLEAAGARLIDIKLSVANGHFMGTARMGDDPQSSVVNRFGLCHDIANLAIVDGSVFVTAGSANPTTTIAALALRTAEHLASTHPDRGAPSPPRTFAGFAPTGRAAEDVAISLGSSPAPPLDQSARARLAMLADVLIPASDDMPAASSVGVADELIDRTLRIRTDLVEAFTRAIAVEATNSFDAAASDAATTLVRLERDDPRALRALRMAVASAYYLSPEVRSRLGYDPSTPQSVRTLDYPEYLEEGLFDHLLT